MNVARFAGIVLVAAVLVWLARVLVAGEPVGPPLP